MLLSCVSTLGCHVPQIVLFNSVASKTNICSQALPCTCHLLPHYDDLHIISLAGNSQAHGILVHTNIHFPEFNPNMTMDLLLTLMLCDMISFLEKIFLTSVASTLITNIMSYPLDGGRITPLQHTQVFSQDFMCICMNHMTSSMRRIALVSKIH